MNTSAKHPPFAVTIYHNPACSTSRQVLASIRESGLEPTVVEYLKTPYTHTSLSAILKATGLTPRQLLRDKGELYEELKLADPQRSDAELMDAMVRHPVLVNRPIVVSPKGSLLCRPKERVGELLP